MALRILIIGVSGFLGRTLAPAFQQQGWEVSGQDLPGTNFPDLPRDSLFDHPLADTPFWRKVFASKNLVLNLAGNLQGNRRRRYLEANVQVPKTLVSLTAGIPEPVPMIHVSSVAALGPTTASRPLPESALCKPVSLYGESKRLGEGVFASSHLPAPVLIVRLPSLYGPGDRCFLDLFRMARAGFFLKLCTRKKAFQLLFRDDVASLLVALIKHQLAPACSSEVFRNLPRLSSNHSTRVLNLGFADTVTDEDLAVALEQSAGRSLRRVFIPRPPVRCAALIERLHEMVAPKPPLFSLSKFHELSQEYWLQDFSFCANLLGPLPVTPLISGISTTWSWYKKEGWL